MVNKLQEVADFYLFKVPSALRLTLGTAGIEEKKNDLSRFFIYPNPAVDKFLFTYSILKASDITLTMADITGKLITTKDLGYQSVGSYSSSLDISCLNSGMYFVKLTAGNESFQKKLIKTGN